MPTPQTSKRSKRKLFVGLGVLAVVIGVIVAPAIVYGSFTVPVTKVKFRETTGSLFTGTAIANVSVVTVWEYLFTVRTAGMVQTQDSNVSSSRGTTNITMSFKLTNPSGQQLDLGSVKITGGIGARDHT